MSDRSTFVPPPRWAVTRWLAAPARTLDAEARDELRAGLFRRMESLLLSALITVVVTTICYVQKPIPLLLWWLVIDAVLSSVRAVIVFVLARGLKSVVPNKTIASIAVDWLFIVGTVWCLQVGIGAGLCIAIGDPALSIYGCLLAMGTVGGQCARNPAAPRLARLQMCLIIIPFACGAAMSQIVAVHGILLLAPFYLWGMITINRELHADYITMIVARIEIRRRAMHCSLTELPNRAFFHQSVISALQDAATGRRQIAVLVLDLDGFKTVNDCFGHPVGDLLLKEVAYRIVSMTLAASMCARLHGDEFAVLMPNGSREASEALARSIIACLSEPFEIGDDVIEIGVSVGLARGGHAAAETFDTLLENGDRALYAAKRAGKGTFLWYDPDASCRVGSDPRQDRPAQAA